MQAPPLVSVVIPVRDGERFLGEAIGSVLAQRGVRLEVVVVDDGSADRSAEVAEGFRARFPELVRVLRSRGEGLSAARNRGIAAAAGELIAFLDADDRFLPDHLLTAVEALSRDAEAAFTYGRIVRLLEVARSRSWIAGASWGWGPGEGRVPGALERLLVGNFVPVQTVVCRRAAVEGVGGFDGGLRFLHQDHLLWSKLALRHPILFRDRPCTEYRVHDASYSSRLDWAGTASDRELDLLRNLTRWVERHDPGAGDRLRPGWRAFGDRAAYRLATSLRRGDARQALREARALAAMRGKGALVTLPRRWLRERAAVRLRATALPG